MWDSQSGVRGEPPSGHDFKLAFALAKAAYNDAMRGHPSLITNVLGIPRGETSPNAGTVEDATVLALTAELRAELAPVVDVRAIVLGRLDAVLEASLGDAVQKMVVWHHEPDLLEMARKVAAACVDRLVVDDASIKVFEWSHGQSFV